jgi:hypothetical protein
MVQNKEVGEKAIKAFALKRDIAEEALRFASRMIRIVSDTFMGEIESETERATSAGSVSGDGKERYGEGDSPKE